VLNPTDFAGARERVWHRKLEDLGFDIVMKPSRVPEEDLSSTAHLKRDVKEIKEDAQLDARTREMLVLARLGQGRYREELLGLWGGQCEVTGCGVTQALRASHAKPWAKSKLGERMDQLPDTSRHRQPRGTAYRARQHCA
jgi:putative restriction endonuclease